jgi:hypothetical protein
MDDLVSSLSSSPPELTTNGKLMVTCAVACFSLNSIKDVRKPGRSELINLFRPKELF